LKADVAEIQDQRLLPSQSQSVKDLQNKPVSSSRRGVGVWSFQKLGDLGHAQHRLLGGVRSPALQSLGAEPLSTLQNEPRAAGPFEESLWNLEGQLLVAGGDKLATLARNGFQVMTIGRQIPGRDTPHLLHAPSL
tara:strand:- start:1194 stop:1598 length:405 start_codon:yes stop_codon:yes gene_type:complete